MPDIKDTDNEIGKFTSIIELRAFFQAELGRLKDDVDKLFEVTTSHGESLSVQSERARVASDTIKEFQGRIDTIMSSFDKFKPFDSEEVKRLVKAGLDEYEKNAEIKNLSNRLEEFNKPTGMLKNALDRMDEIEKVLKEIGSKNSNNESETKDLKVRLTIFISIGAVIAMKLLDLGLNLIKNIGK